MARDIIKFLRKKSQEEVILGNFEELSKNVKSKKELRLLEMNLLRPKPIPEYMGPKPTGLSDFKKQSLLLTFQDKKYVDRFSKFFRVNRYIENNTHNVEFFVELIRLFESGRLIWNEDKKKYYLRMKNKKLLKI